jgi:hypothetical protein
VLAQAKVDIREKATNKVKIFFISISFLVPYSRKSAEKIRNLEKTLKLES